MSLATTVCTGWHRFLATLYTDDRQRLLATVCDAYRTEALAAAQLTQHAHRMYYPQFCERLLRMAAESQAQLPWLEEQIRTLGGHRPQRSATPRRGGNSWECLHRDLEAAQRAYGNLLAGIHLAEHQAPALALGLRRIRESKYQHRDALRDMLMRSDPYTSPCPMTPHEQEEPQKQAWLAQRKGEWLDHARAEWEAEGKPVPWATWAGEQEWRWTTELPHRELEWAQRRVEQETA